jgi:hypothetical protein
VTKRDRKALGKYMRECADLMELRDWHLDLSHDPPAGDDDAYASCEPIEGRRKAVFRFAADFRKQDPETQRMVVAHELVHCHLAMAQLQAEQDTYPLGPAASSLFQATFRRNLEYGVDGLAHALAKHLPLIDWPKPK